MRLPSSFAKLRRKDKLSGLWTMSRRQGAFPSVRRARTVKLWNANAADKRDEDWSKVRLLAVASAGGHWEELMLLRPAFEPFMLEFATTDPELALRDGIARVFTLPDSNRHEPLKALRSFWAAWRLVRALRPDFIVTTGALPGLLCVIAGRSVGAKAIWVDSIANSERPSLSGACARWFATLWLTQWEALAKPSGPLFMGALL